MFGPNLLSEPKVCYDYVERGMCKTGNPNRECTYSHDLALVLPTIQRLCEKKLIERATRMVRSMATKESPMNKFIFSDNGKRIVGTVINAIIKVKSTTI